VYQTKLGPASPGIGVATFREHFQKQARKNYEHYQRP
jgi:hypothetical protein